MLVRSLHRPSNAIFSSQRRTWTSLSRQVNGLTIHALDNTTFPYSWLRDSCQSPESVHPSTKQKLHRTSDIPFDIVPEDGESGVRVTTDGLEITWNDGHKSVFQKHWLERFASPTGLERFHRNDALKERGWTRSSISSTRLFIPYQDILSSDENLVKAMEQLCRYGLLFVRGVPNEETNNDKCELKKLAEIFGELRKTFYGVLWDVVNLKDSKNIAYTNLDLGLHMDLL